MSYHFPLLRILFFYLVVTSAPVLAESTGPAPLRQGVDVYNSVGSLNRLVGFMKIGADPRDLRYLADLNARTVRQPVPKAILSGGLIYFRNLPEPLKVIDLKTKQFSFNGRRIDLKSSRRIEQRMLDLEKIIYPRSAFFIWDWFLPEALAATLNPSTLSTLAGVLSVGAVSSGTYCLNDPAAHDCSKEFMGTLASIGAVGGLERTHQAAQVFCSPDFRGGQKFIVASDKGNLLSLSQSHGQYEISPASLLSDSPSAMKASSELLASCQKVDDLRAMNVALAQPTRTTPITTLPFVSSTSGRSPAATAPPVVDSEQSSATR